MTESDADEAEVTVARMSLMATLLSSAAVPKPLPETVTVSPPLATVGLMLEGDGAAKAPTAKDEEVDAVPEGVVTETNPSLAPEGTVTVRRLGLAAVTVAPVLPKATALSEAVEENPVP